MGRPVSPRAMRYELEAPASVPEVQESPAPVEEERGPRATIKRGLPSPVKVVIRAFMVLGMLALFLWLDAYDPLEPKVPVTSVEFTLFLAGCVSIATVFCAGYLLLTHGSRGRPGVEADIPSMLLVWAKAGLSIGVAYVAYVAEFIPRFAWLFIAGAMAAFWAAFATAGYVYYAFRRIF